MNLGSPALWKWVQHSNFQHPEHPEWDLIQWDLEDELVLGPRLVSHPVNDPPDEWWYLRTKDAPGLNHLPTTIVLFRIVSEPSATSPGVIEGQEAWWDDDLETALLRGVQGRPNV
jgi:hypothetical protein